MDNARKQSNCIQASFHCVYLTIDCTADILILPAVSVVHGGLALTVQQATYSSTDIAAQLVTAHFVFTQIFPFIRVYPWAVCSQVNILFEGRREITWRKWGSSFLIKEVHIFLTPQHQSEILPNLVSNLSGGLAVGIFFSDVKWFYCCQ